MPAIFHKLLIVIVLVGACFGFWNNGSHVVKDDDVTGHLQAADQISAEREMPDYNGSPYLIVNSGAFIVGFSRSSAWEFYDCRAGDFASSETWAYRYGEACRLADGEI